jgi:hypothetical protein
MKPDVDVYLKELASDLLEDFVPNYPTSFGKGALVRHSLLVQVVSEEYDRAAARRIEENAELRRLFAKDVDIIPTGDLADRLRQAAASKDDGLLVAQLDHSNRLLRALLVELHARIETIEGSQAREYEKAIWHELVLSTERRRLSIDTF